MSILYEITFIIKMYKLDHLTEQVIYDKDIKALLCCPVTCFMPLLPHTIIRYLCCCCQTILIQYRYTYCRKYDNSNIYIYIYSSINIV